MTMREKRKYLELYSVVSMVEVAFEQHHNMAQRWRNLLAITNVYHMSTLECRVRVLVGDCVRVFVHFLVSATRNRPNCTRIAQWIQLKVACHNIQNKCKCCLCQIQTGRRADRQRARERQIYFYCIQHFDEAHTLHFYFHLKENYFRLSWANSYRLIYLKICKKFHLVSKE